MKRTAVGKKLPDFSAPSTQGQISQSSLNGHLAVLYFYPRDNTPGCTTEAQDFRDHYADFKRTNCQIIGISRDSMSSHENFTEKHQLPFALISDEDEALCETFGVIKMKNMYGKQVRGIERSTFLVDRNGVLVQEWRGLRVPGHVEQVLQATRAIA
jgi:thioredoxin-dependent peroxiredoxin